VSAQGSRLDLFGDIKCRTVSVIRCLAVAQKTRRSDIVQRVDDLHQALLVVQFL